MDLDAAREKGIVVCNVRDNASRSVAQHVMTMIMNLVTHQPAYAEQVRAGTWSRGDHFSLHKQTIRELSDLQLGIVGYGVLGKAVASLAKAMGMNVLVAEQRGRNPRPDRLGFEKVLAAADVISLHCPVDHPLLQADIPNLIVTPHNAWASKNARQACIDQLSRAISVFNRGQYLNRVI